MTKTERDRATRHIETVQRLRRELGEEYERVNPRRTIVSDLHAAIGVHLKLADVHAQLATAAAVDDLRGDLVEALRRSADRVLDRPSGLPDGLHRLDGTRVS